MITNSMVPGSFSVLAESQAPVRVSFRSTMGAQKLSVECEMRTEVPTINDCISLIQSRANVVISPFLNTKA